MQHHNPNMFALGDALVQQDQGVGRFLRASLIRKDVESQNQSWSVWLSWLEQCSMHEGVPGSIPDRGACVKWPVNVSLLHLSLSLSLSLSVSQQ